MLKSEPMEASEGARLFWNELEPLSCELFQQFYAKASPDSPHMDVSNVEYKTWRDAHGYTYTGMKHKDTGKAHGIVRVVKQNDLFQEACYNHGVRHGLNRILSKDFIKLYLNREGLELGFVHFDRSLNEVNRSGTSDQVAVLTTLAKLMFLKE